MTEQIVDMLGNAFTIGCKVARPTLSGNTPIINICTVTKIENGIMYLDNSAQFIRMPKRLLIIEQDPLYKMIVDYKK